jgi:hypothetical protein
MLDALNEPRHNRGMLDWWIRKWASTWRLGWVAMGGAVNAIENLRLVIVRLEV